MNIRILVTAVCLLLVLGISVVAEDVAYVLKNAKKPNQDFLQVFDKLELSVKLVDDSNVKKTNFSQYNILFVDGEMKQLTNSKSIPVGNMPTIVANMFHPTTWGLTEEISSIVSNKPLKIHIIGGSIHQAYTSCCKPGGVGLPMYYLSDFNKAEGFEKVAETFINEGLIEGVVQYLPKGKKLLNGKTAKGNLCFYGITETDFWEPISRDLFEDCVRFVDPTTIDCKNDSDCDDGNDLTLDECINPGTKLSFCEHTKIECNDDEDCENDILGELFCKNSAVFQNVTSFNCENPGKKNSECKGLLEEQFKQNCPFGCEFGMCIGVHQCEDGLDNDLDGAVDYPEDFSCDSLIDDDEKLPMAQCQDGLDNDGDLLVDLDDPGCSNNQDNDEFNFLSHLELEDIELFFENGTKLNVNENSVISAPAKENVTLIGTVKNTYTIPEGVSIENSNVTILVEGILGKDLKLFKNVGKLTPQEEFIFNFEFNTEDDGGIFDTSLETLGIDGVSGDLHEDLFQFKLEVISSDIHDIGLKEDYDGFGHRIRIKNESNAIVPDEIVEFEPNDTIDLQFLTENKGDFVENVSIEVAIVKSDGTIVFKEFKTKDNLAIGGSTTTGNKNNFALNFPSGDYNITVNIDIINFNDANPEDNFALRQMTLLGEAQCNDKIDNDLDGAIDYPEDFSCDSLIDDDELLPKSQCQDGLDNDGDLLVDLDDPGCKNNQDDDESDGTSQCQDKIDNDKDGFIDYPADPGCVSKTDKSELPFNKAQCDDGLDNDKDGFIDYPADKGCVSKIDNNELPFNIAQCNDGLDNDKDGFIDYPVDLGCVSKIDNSELPFNKAQCDDGLDNDGDKYIDYPIDKGCISKIDNDESK